MSSARRFRYLYKSSRSAASSTGVNARGFDLGKRSCKPGVPHSTLSYTSLKALCAASQLGTKPDGAIRSRPCAKVAALPIAAINAVAIMMPALGLWSTAARLYLLWQKT
jgi:hypothetical protein